MLAVPSPVSYSTSATAGSRITVGRSRVGEGVAHIKGALADRWMGWQPHTTASHQCSKLKPNVHATTAAVLLTLHVDVHVLAHALPDGVRGKAGVGARVVPAFGFLQSLDVAKHHSGQLSFENCAQEDCLK